MPDPHLVANVLRLAAVAVDATDCAAILAVSVAMDVVGTADPDVFADALLAIHLQPETRSRGDRARAAATTLSNHEIIGA